MASIDDIRDNRIKKLSDLRGKGIDPYPAKSKADYTLAEASEKFSKISGLKKAVSLVGRVLSLRPQGAIIFFTFDDGTGKFQGFIKKSEQISDEDFDSFQTLVDIGDFVEVSGKLFTTSRGEKTIQVEKWKMLTKSLR